MRDVEGRSSFGKPHFVLLAFGWTGKELQGEPGTYFGASKLPTTTPPTDRLG